MSYPAFPLEKITFKKQLQDLKRFKRNPPPLMPRMFELRFADGHLKEAATVMLESGAKEPREQRTITMFTKKEKMNCCSKQSYQIHLRFCNSIILHMINESNDSDWSFFSILPLF